jgi:hypothetical protein
VNDIRLELDLMDKKNYNVMAFHALDRLAVVME